jgi:hypothetical protein
MASKFRILSIALVGLIPFIFLSVKLYENDYFGVHLSTQAPSFVARVTLSTNCQITNDAFAVHNFRTKKDTAFRYGEAFVRVRNGDELKLVVSEKFPDFEVTSEILEAQKHLVFKHDCDAPSLDSIFDSMNKKFGVKSPD